MMPRPMFDIQLNLLQWGLAFVIDFDWGHTGIVIGPIAITTLIGFQWKTRQYQDWFHFDWHKPE